MLWQTFQKELGKYQKEVDAANASGEHLISDVLDDPAVTKQDLEELNEAWETTRQLSLKKQERMNEALKDAKKFEGGLNDLVMWIDAQSAKLQSQLPPDEDASVLQQQIEEHKVCENFIRLTFAPLAKWGADFGQLIRSWPNPSKYMLRCTLRLI